MRNQPTDVLPSELLSMIFLWGLPNSKYRFKVDKYRRSISQVCRSWRTICLDTPRFWRAVYITIDDDDFLPPHNWLIMEPIIRRAGIVPLDLTINIFSSSRSSVVLHLMRCLKPHIDRLRELHFTSSCLDPILEFFPLPRSMPYLKTLDIRLNGNGNPKELESQASVELWDCTSSFPALESFTIDGTDVATVRFSFQSISCDQVLDLNIINVDGFGDRERVKYITGFKRLRSLGLHPELQMLKCPPLFSYGSLHSLKLSSSMGIVPGRSMGDTSFIHHLELITRSGHDPLRVFESKDLPCLRTVSHPTKFVHSLLYCHTRMNRFIRNHPSIFAIGMHPAACYNLLKLLFFEGLTSSLETPHNVRFVRFLVPNQLGNIIHKDVLRRGLGSKWAPRFEWVFLDACRSASDRSLNIDERIRVLAEEFPKQFRWIEDDEAIPMDEILSLGADGWPIRE